MDTLSWRDETLNQLRAMAEADARIVALGIFGSLLHPELVDRWSDIDLFLVVADDAVADFAQSPSWLAGFGEIFSLTCAGDDARQATLKVIFADFRKLDIVIATRSAVERGGVPLLAQRLLVVKDERLAARLRESDQPTSPATPALPSSMIDEFWFLAYTAVAKLMRNDQLIALHLALELPRMNLVLGMILRDRDLGTNVHRTGGVRNDVVTQVLPGIAIATPEDILALIERSGQAFDRLAAELDPNYTERSSTFHRVIACARDDLAMLGEA